METKDGKYRDYFCGFCYPTASDGSDADEEAKEKGLEKAQEYTGQELLRHLEKEHTKAILEAFYEQFIDDHSHHIAGYNTFTGEKCKTSPP